MLGSYFGLLCILIIFFGNIQVVVCQLCVERVLKLALSEMFDVNGHSQLKVLLTITCVINIIQPKT